MATTNKDKKHTPAKKTMTDLIAELHTRRAETKIGGGEDRHEKQRAQGKMTARERVDNLVDNNSLEEFGMFARHRQTKFGMLTKAAPADGVVTGAASIDGRLVHLASQDFSVLGGSAGEVHSLKVADAMHRSLKTGSPFIFINDSGGARVQEGIDSLSGYGQVFHSNVLLSGAVPQISLICGPCAGGAAYSPALTDFIIQTRKAQMFITGPQVIKQVTGEDISAEELGGADAHMAHSGVVHFVAEDDEEALHICRRLLSFLPSNNLEGAPFVPGDENVEPNPELNNIVPVDPKVGYDVRRVITGIVDRGDFLEVQAGHAQNMVVGFSRILGNTVGIIANQPAVLAGAIDNHAANKAARFIRFCNAFNLPMVTMVDVPGYLPGIEQEHNGIIRNGAKLLFAYSAATVPMIQLILRKSYGGAHVAMCSRDIAADCVLAWPTAEIAVMGAEGAVEIVFRKEMQEAEDKVARRAELIQEYRDAFASPYVAAGRRLVDDIIEPANTRKHLARALEYLKNKRDQRPPKKHGLIPL
jgi:methylmalonyl-CoA carboxyltransferase large subunit